MPENTVEISMDPYPTTRRGWAGCAMAQEVKGTAESSTMMDQTTRAARLPQVPGAGRRRPLPNPVATIQAQEGARNSEDSDGVDMALTYQKLPPAV